MEVGREELALRETLTRSITILERLGIVDFNGHCSARMVDGRILINSGSSVRSAIAPDDFVVVDEAGRMVAGEAKPPAELPLHLAVYDARPDVRAVVHGHPKWSTLLTSANQGYRPLMAQGALLGDVPVFDSPRSVNNPDTAASVARSLASGRATLLRAHGCVVAGGDPLEATVLAIYLELNAERQVGAAMLGEPCYFSSEEIDACRQALSKRALFQKCWNYYLAKFDLAQ